MKWAVVNVLCVIAAFKDERASAQAQAVLRKYGPRLERWFSSKPAFKAALERLQLHAAGLKEAPNAGRRD